MTLDRILDKLKQWGRPWADGSEPVEIHRAILEDIAAQVVAVGGGRRIFPFDRVEVTLLAPPGERERLEAVVHAGWDLDREAADRLRTQGARVPAGFAVIVTVTDQPTPDFGTRHYAVAFRTAPAAPAGTPPAAGAAKTAAAPAAGPSDELSDDVPTARLAENVSEADRPASPAPAAPLPSPRTGALPALHIAVLKGKAVRDTFDLAAERIYLGRLEEVLDANGRVKRRNDVAFLEEGDLSQTVSREHARIAWDAETQSYWLRDEASSAGTVIFRSGRSIEVSRHDRRGVRLQDGDEVFLGRAAVKITLASTRR